MKSKVSIRKNLDECKRLDEKWKELRAQGMSEEDISAQLGFNSVSALRLNLYHAARVVKIAECNAVKVLNDNGFDIPTICLVTSLTRDIVEMLLNKAD